VSTITPSVSTNGYRLILRCLPSPLADLRYQELIVVSTITPSVSTNGYRLILRCLPSSLADLRY
jgi:hypothetical protein